VLHPLISDERLNLARYELSHDFFVHILGFHVHGIELDSHEGRTEITYPLAPEQFMSRYQQSPLSAALTVVRILAAVRCASYCELRGGQVGGEPSGRDLTHIQLWREAVLPLYDQGGWTRLYAASFQGLQQWYRNGGVQHIFRELGPWVAQQVSISRYALLTALELAGAGLAPDPHFEVPLPPPRRAPTPAPAQASSRSSQRRAETQAAPLAALADGDAPAVYSNVTPAHEDSRLRIYALDHDGDRALYRIQTKATGRSIYALVGDGVDGGIGKARLQTEEFGTEFEARRHMRRRVARR
jgi:hypothetical protein